MFSKFSEEAQKILMASKKEMEALKHSYVGSEHLFLALLKYNNEFIECMKELGITYNLFKEKIIESIGIGDSSNKWFVFTPLLKRIIETSQLISKESSNGEVTPDHLIYACFEEDDGIALKILNDLDIDYSEIQNNYSKKIIYKRKNSKKKLIIEEYGVDLTRKALNNELDPVIGRDEEIKRIMEILCRRTKNNPLLLGDAGVGKTALVEELARLIVLNKVPPLLRNKRIISISIASLVAGTKYRGEFEERITKMLKEIEECNDIFLFIDEIHTIMGAGGAEGAIDAANIFKPALARGNIRLIGATTTDEYNETILKDKAMERRFQIINVLEPSLDNLFLILKNLRPIYEKYHGVIISDEILKNIISLSNRYIFDRKQPDKCIDILDEVSSKVSLNKTNNIYKLDNYKNELYQIQEEKNNYLIKHDYINACKKSKKEKELLSKLNNYKIKGISNKYKKIELSDVLSVISLKSNIPVDEMVGINNKYLMNLSNKLHNSIYGQDEAIDELLNITKKIKSGFKKDNKPVSFLFVGPTGVGKTKLALEYGKSIFNNNVIKIDLSEYRDTSSINKLLGSPPGYIGYDNNKYIFEEIRRKPYSLILLDEIEKASSEVMNLFLQILDNGIITDNKGNKIYFNNTIIIFTSNVGYNKDEIGFIDKECKEDSKIKDFMSIELLNRIQKVIYFNKMNYNDINSIVKMRLKYIKKAYKDKNINIHISESIIKKIIDESRYKEFGARKIDYIIEKNIDNIVINSFLNGKKEITIK